MRLIELDKAIEATWEEPHYTDPLNVLTEVRDRLIDLPTVEAIPIEWIRKYTKETPLYQSDDLALYIEDMIADWAERKEE